MSGILLVTDSKSDCIDKSHTSFSLMSRSPIFFVHAKGRLYVATHTEHTYISHTHSTHTQHTQHMYTHMRTHSTHTQHTHTHHKHHTPHTHTSKPHYTHIHHTYRTHTPHTHSLTFFCSLAVTVTRLPWP